jgi:hypothetical protein
VNKVIVSGSSVYLATNDGLFAWDGGRNLPSPLSSLAVADMALDGDALVFTEQWDNNFDPRSVWRMPLDGGTPVAIAPSYSTVLGGIAADGDNVYFIDRVGARDVNGFSEGGAVVRVSKLTNEITVFATDPYYQPIDVVVDDKCEYWTALLGGTPPNVQLPNTRRIYATPK